MKILQINCVYKKGSTGKIVYDIHSELQKNDIESIVCYGRGAHIDESHVYKTCGERYSKFNNLRSRITGKMYDGCRFSTKKLIRILQKEKPDIVHLQCINGHFVNIYSIVEYLRNNKIKTVLTLHAEFMYTGGCGYAIECNQWRNQKGCGSILKCPRYRSEFHSYFDRTSLMWNMMKNAFENFDDNLIVTSVSPWLMNRAKQSPILKNKKHCVVFNGLDIDVFHPSSDVDRNQIRKKLQIKTEKVIFHATPNFNNNPNHIKGGYYVIELAKRMPEVTFVVAGLKTEEFDIPNNLIVLGEVTNQKELAGLYSMADVTLLTSQRETFSMVTAESLCCGTPVVGFYAGGPESIAIEEFSFFVSHGDIDALYRAVNIKLNDNKNIDISKKATEIYSKQRMVNDYIKCYKELLN